jgi:hypothetical protein
MPIFYDKKIIFIRVPKTASTSLEKAIGPGAVGPRHEKIANIKSRIPQETYDEFYKFAFVRNPWDWMVSWAYYKAGIEMKRRGSQEARQHAWSNFDFNKWIEGLGRVVDSRGGKFWTPSVEFAAPSKNVISCGLTECRSKLGLPCVCLMRGKQWEFVCDNNKNIMVDFIGRFENLHEDWEIISSRFKINNKLKHTNKTDHLFYKDLYTDKAAEIVNNIYKEDIDMFEYKF